MRWASVLGVGAAVYFGLALYLFVFQARYVYFPELPSRQVEATPADIGLAFDAVTLRTADDDEARRLLEQAAAQGMAAAQLALGRFHERGEGVPLDATQALKWYALALHFARSGPGLFDNAAFAGRAQTAYDALASRMDPSRKGQGLTLARQWLANPQRQHTATMPE